MAEIRLIDANALKEALCEFMKNNIGIYSNEMLYLIDNAPAIPQTIVTEFKGCDNCELERQKGEWILQYRTCGDEFYTCSLCKRAIEVDYPQTLKDFPFCHCGADMRGDNKETTFDDYLKEQLKDPEFKKEWDKLRDEKRGKENADVQ